MQGASSGVGRPYVVNPVGQFRIQDSECRERRAVSAGPALWTLWGNSDSGFTMQGGANGIGPPFILNFES